MHRKQRLWGWVKPEGMFLEDITGRHDWARRDGGTARRENTMDKAMGDGLRVTRAETCEMSSEVIASEEWDDCGWLST